MSKPLVPVEVAVKFCAAMNVLAVVVLKLVNSLMRSFVALRPVLRVSELATEEVTPNCFAACKLLLIR